MVDNIKKLFNKTPRPYENMWVIDKGEVTIVAGSKQNISKLRKTLQEEGDEVDIQMGFYKEPIYYMEVR